MDSSSLILISIAASGAIYYGLYRVIFHQKLKWKMLHSIWLPLAVALFGIVVAGSLLMQPQTGGSMGDLAAIVTLMVFLFPVVIFFVLYFVFYLVDKRK
jgi:hypothetical protein